MGDVIYLKKKKDQKNAMAQDAEKSELYAFFCEFVEGFRERGYDIIDITVAPFEMDGIS